MTDGGIRLTALPALGAVTDASKFAGARGGAGLFTATALKAYINPISVKNFGVIGDGVTDDTAAINALDASVSAAGGGRLHFPAGTYIVTGLIKRSDTIWTGDGMGVTVIKLKAGTTADAVVAGLDAYTLFGGNGLVGIVNWSIRDLTIDGNRTGGCTSDGLGVYGWVFDLNCVEIKSCNGRGWRNEYGQPGIEEHLHVQSQAANMLVWDNQTDGIYFCGPNDSLFTNLNVYWNLQYGIWLAGLGTIKAVACHVWSDGLGGRQNTVCWRLDSPLNLLIGCVGEGASVTQCWLRNVNNIIVDGLWFYNQASPNTVEGIRLGDAAGTGGSVQSTSGNTITGRVDNCQAGAIVYSSDNGLNRIDVTGTNVTTASTGFSGANGSGSRTRIHITNCTTNPVLNTEALALGVSGMLTAGGGLTIPTLGSGGGLVVAGPADGGGVGFRLLVVPN